MPTFPSGSPFVTSVGATNTLNDAAASFSSGGFSNMCGQRASGWAAGRRRDTPSSALHPSRPSRRYAAQPYQTAHIANYLKNTTGVPATKHFNQTGRGFPDVSTIGESFWIFCQVRGAGGGALFAGVGFQCRVHSWAKK